MIVFPPCKINLGLSILRKRSDGFHDLETVFYPLPLYDILELIKLNEHQDHHALRFSSSGRAIEGPEENNLCIRAWKMVATEYPQLGPAFVHLHKTIPMGAGLGGGSADAAFMLKLIDKTYQLGLSADQLAAFALRLGSDCPFFLQEGPCLAHGRGEQLQPLTLDLSHYRFVVVNPGIHVRTAQAFSQVTPHIPGQSIDEIIHQPIESWKNSLVNDFEVPVFRQYPELQAAKEALYRSGAIYASMSGSGSSLYGLFQKDSTPKFDFPPHYFVSQLVTNKN